jgi:hypothetical protein
MRRAPSFARAHDLAGGCRELVRQPLSAEVNPPRLSGCCIQLDHPSEA